MLTPLPVANLLLVVAATLFAIALAEGIFVVHAALAVAFAGQLVGKAVKS